MIPRTATPYNGEPKSLDYCGMDVTVNYDPNLTKFMKKRGEIWEKEDITFEKWLRMSDEEQGRIVALAMVGTVVANIADCEFPMPDGQPAYHFSFNAPSDVEGYSTCGEEILGIDDMLRNHVLTYCNQLHNFKNQEEVRAVKKSSTPSDSIQSLTGQPVDVALTG